MFKIINRRYTHFKIFFCISVIFLALVPVLFSLHKMGLFIHSPKVEIENIVPENAKVLRVVADYDFSPHSFYDSNNQKMGLDVELINEVSNRLGYKADISFYDWPTCRQKIQSGEADIILGLEIFSDLQGVCKSIPVSHDRICVFGKSKITDIASLAGTKVGIISDSIIKSLFSLHCEYQEFNTNTQILKAIEDGVVDFGICHESIANKIIERDSLEILDCSTLMKSYLAIGISNEKIDLSDRINEVLHQMSDDGTLHRLEEKWIDFFASNISLLSVLKDNEYFFILYFIAYLVYIFMMILVNLNLKSQIKIKKHFDILSSVAEIYMSMHYIDLVDDSVVESLSVTQDISKEIVSENTASKKMLRIMKKNIMESDIERALTFTDLTTISARLRNRKSITADFVGKNVGWFRAQFIAVSKDAAGEVITVVFTTQVIDEEKKREQELIYLSSVDELTRLFNRRAYEVDASAENKNMGKDFVYISFDLNGLKKLNDTKGHAAGDELLQGASDCLSMVFVPYGKIYRMGGDEFAAMLHICDEDLDELMDSLDKILKRWNGTFVKGISISLGVVKSKDYPGKSVEELAVIADDLMYEAKQKYYQETGEKR